MTVLDDTLAAVTDQWEGHTQIWKRMNCWSPRTVKERLVALAEQGVIETKFFPHPSGTISKYRKKSG